VTWSIEVGPSAQRSSSRLPAKVRDAALTFVYDSWRRIPAASASRSDVS
jgi:hypothetical protein